MIAPATARNSYVVPALQRLNLYSAQAERLLMGTAAIESNFQNFVQFGGGPARGMFQMEQVTYLDIVNRYLALGGHKHLKTTLSSLTTSGNPTFLELAQNHLLAAGLARVKYAMIHGAIPITLAGQADYWWVHYNGRSAHGLKPADYITRWHSYCAALYPDFK